MHVGKGAFFDKGQRFGVVFLGLAGEARDEIGRQRAAGKGTAQPLGHGKEGGGIILAVHSAQRLITAGLEREVEVVAELAARRDLFAEFVRDDRGLERAEADAHVAGDFPDRRDDVGKSRFSRQINAVGGDLDAREHELAIALRGKARSLGTG